MEAYEKLDYGTYTEIEGKIFRSPSSSFFRYLAPLLFGVLVLSIIEHLDERFSELRVATPPTILLTFIFMHSGYQSQIPQLSYITFMDKIFFLCYFLALISLISAVVSMNKHIILNRYLNKYMRIDFSKLLRFIFATSAIFIPFIMYYFV